jgi:hypothetical protein
MTARRDGERPQAKPPTARRALGDFGERVAKAHLEAPTQTYGGTAAVDNPTGASIRRLAERGLAAQTGEAMTWTRAI